MKPPPVGDGEADLVCMLFNKELCALVCVCRGGGAGAHAIP